MIKRDKKYPEIAQKSVNSGLQNISYYKTTEFNLETTLFGPESGRSLDWELFLAHPLGQLYKTIPFREITKLLPVKKNKCGVKGRFTQAGGLGLQILKHYYKQSDKKLIEQLNSNWAMQYFCGIQLKKGEQIKDEEVVGRWRAYFGLYLDVDLAQYALAQVWQEQMEQTQTNLSDATCIESYVRFPTDAKLLWECVDYLWHQLKCLSKALRLPMFRSKFKELKKDYTVYSKRRRKTHKLTKAIKRRLLHLLTKLLKITPGIIAYWKRQPTPLEKYPVKRNFFERLSTIKKVLAQQQLMFTQGVNKVKDRIISLAKPYLRPIVRGKENKRVEFGMKVNAMQVDGINFIEYGSFDAFHEGIRLKKTIWKHRRYFGLLTQVGADTIYATNKNRKFCKQQEIFTGFVPKGKQGKNQEQQRILRHLISKERATRLEGSFGTVKNHYLLDKVKARTKHTEIAWIFFGFLTADIVAMSKKTKPPPK